MRITWIARCPTPYRYPIWANLSHSHSLQVLFLQEQGIGRTWRIEPRDDFPQRVLKTSGVRYREDALWVLRSGWKQHIAGSDVVIMQGLWETPAAWQIAAWCRIHGVPLIYFSESTLASMHKTHGAIRKARSFYMRNAQMVITPGPAATAAALAHGVREEKVVTSVNVIDVRRFHDGAWDRRKGSTAEAPDTHRYIIVARLVALKNIDSALRAFAALPGPAHLEIIGDGPERPALQHLASHLGIQERVNFLGELDSTGVITRLAAAHTLILPSTEDVWGLVANEALAAGLHAVVSECCGVAPSISEQRGVYICPPTPNAIAGAMQKSATDWQGWINDPEILKHDGARFTSDVGRCLATVQRTSRQRGTHD